MLDDAYHQNHITIREDQVFLTISHVLKMYLPIFIVFLCKEFSDSLIVNTDSSSSIQSQSLTFVCAQSYGDTETGTAVRKTILLELRKIILIWKSIWGHLFRTAKYLWHMVTLASLPECSLNFVYNVKILIISQFLHLDNLGEYINIINKICRR